jgi:hypothetical protein
MVPLIKALWAAGYETVTCCQNISEANAGVPHYRSRTAGYALLEMPVADTCRLLDAVKDTPQFRDRMHWMNSGAWSVSIPVLPDPYGTGAAPLPFAQIYIPRIRSAT